VAYTLKHFPGLGRADGNTDLGPVTIGALASALRADYRAYPTCGTNPLALVMVSNASYPALSGPLPAVMSPAIYHRELPFATNDAPEVTISDDLQAGAIANQPAPARRAFNAGLDMAMYAQTEQASASAYETLLQDARSGALSMDRIHEADRAIASLKRHVVP
jgi:beta-N-acetylhexosaminidase